MIFICIRFTVVVVFIPVYMYICINSWLFSTAFESQYDKPSKVAGIADEVSTLLGYSHCMTLSS